MSKADSSACLKKAGFCTKTCKDRRIGEYILYIISVMSICPIDPDLAGLYLYFLMSPFSEERRAMYRNIYNSISRNTTP